MKSLLFIAFVLISLLTATNVYAGGPRLDYPSDSTEEGADCWVDGYDAGFAGKYDADRADECANENDEYNRSWGYACIDGGVTKIDCDQIKGDPVDVQDHETLQQENAQNCWNDGYEDGKADYPYNKDRASGCSEYTPDYEDGYNSGCIIDSTDNTCKLIIEGEKGFCPWHPDIAGCMEFLHNATNKRPASTTGACAGMGDPRPWVICPQESNPEGYCLMTDDPAFCKTVGDLCDADGFVKPEYPYCTK